MRDDHGVKNYASALYINLGSNPPKTYQNLFNHHGKLPKIYLP